MQAEEILIGCFVECQSIKKVGGRRSVEELYQALFSFRPSRLNVSPSETKIEPDRGLFDIRTWMADITTDLRNIINPHCFVLRKSSKGYVVLKYKNRTRESEWKPSNNLDDGIVILPVNTNFLV